jgi:CrcB protein
MTAAVWIGFLAAAAAGATARMFLQAGWGRPGILVVNVSGAFALGLITGLALYHGLSHTSRTVLGTGFCGAYTTFSTFSLDTAVLAGEGQSRAAVVNVVLSVALGLAAAGAGIALMAWF